MERTLFTSPMIETYRACKKAYERAFVKTAPGPGQLGTSAIAKKFLLKAIEEINRGRLTTVNQVQKFLGQHWPSEVLSQETNLDKQEESIRAFRFVYRALTNFVEKPYRPEGAKVVGVNLKVRARIPHTKTYIEDTFDLILFHPETGQLELVDFHVAPLKQLNPAWPTASILVKRFLADRLLSRWPAKKVVATFCQIKADTTVPVSIELNESLYKLHWPQLLNTIEAMQNMGDDTLPCEPQCRRCKSIDANTVNEAPISHSNNVCHLPKSRSA